MRATFPPRSASLADEFGGSPGDYVLEAERRISVDGRSFWAAKFSDERSGTIRLVYRDDAGRTGGPELMEAAQERSRDAGSPLERKASPELLDVASAARTGALLPVAVWLDVDTKPAVQRIIDAHPEGRWSGDRPATADAKVQDALQRRIERARARAYEAAARAALRQVEADGGRLGYVSTLAPLAYIDTPAGSLDELAASPRVRTMGLEGNAWSESMSSAGPFVGAGWHSGDLDRANGVRVGVIEYYNVRATGDLAGKVAAFHSESGSTSYTPTDQFDHPTWVAGAIASQDSTHRGMSPGALIVSSGTGGGASGLTRDRNVIRATDWAATTGGAHILNISLNMDSTTGRDEARAYFDAIGGRRGHPDGDRLGGQLGDGRRCWHLARQLAGDELERPDGRRRQRRDRTPVVRRVMPLLGRAVGRGPGLAVQPAWRLQQAERVGSGGERRDGERQACVGDERRGADRVGHRRPAVRQKPDDVQGVARGDARDHHGERPPADPAARWRNEHRSRGRGDGARAVGPPRLRQPHVRRVDEGHDEKGASVTKSFSVRAGQRVRIALAWDSHTTGTMFDRTDRLQADLDLVVTYPGGTRKSLSYDNANEFVSFQAPSSGTVSVRIAQSRFDGDSEHWALAWLRW